MKSYIKERFNALPKETQRKLMSIIASSNNKHELVSLIDRTFKGPKVTGIDKNGNRWCWTGYSKLADLAIQIFSDSSAKAQN